MKLTVNIDTDNAAFEGDNLGPELARILHRVATAVKDLESEPAEFELHLRDINGYRVGSADL
jgi:hypothetical protein